MQRAQDRPHAHKLYLSWDNRDLTISGEVADIAAIELDLERATGSPACKGHTRRDHWEFTTLYSNTARADELGRMKDSVVMYFHAPGQPEAQRTVVTEKRGPLSGKWVVRGREAECLQHYGAEPDRRASH